MFQRSIEKLAGLFLVSVLVLSTQTSYSQENESKDEQEFTIGVQIRPRFEGRHGFKRPIADTSRAASFVEQRSRIWADYRTSKFHLHVNLQDVRMWGSTNQIYKADPSIFNAYEAYGEYFFNETWTMKLGRQALDYDNARFLGNLDWAQQGRSHDAILFKYHEREENFEIHLGGGFNQFQNEPSYLTYQPYTLANNKYQAFLWAHKKWEKFKTSFLFHNDGREKANGNLASRYTIALIPTYSTDKFQIDGEFYSQLGQNAAAQDVSAYFISLAFTWKTKLTPITVGADIASGTSLTDSSNVDNSWNPLYGTNHKFYGYMDYFYVGNGHGQAPGRAGGLMDYYLKTKFKLGSKNKHNILFHLHYFMSPVDVFDPNDINNTLDPGLGTEIDLVYTFVFTKGLTGNLGYSQMFATESMKAVKGINDNTDPQQYTKSNYWVWAQINFKMDVFKSKK